MTAAENKRLVRRLYDEVWNKGDFELFDQIYAPKHIQHNPLPGQRLTGRDALRAGLRDLREAAPDLKVAPGLMLCRGDEVTAVLTIRGTHTSSYVGFAPTGRPFAIAAIVIHKIADGKIVESWSSHDEESLARQLGGRPGGNRD